MELNLHNRSQRKAAKARVAQFDDRISAIAASVAGRFARGSVALQQGYVVTRAQLDAERNVLNADKRRR